MQERTKITQSCFNLRDLLPALFHYPLAGLKVLSLFLTEIFPRDRTYYQYILAAYAALMNSDLLNAGAP